MSSDFVSHSVTSQQAANNTRRSRSLKTMHILEYLAATPEGATSFQIEAHFGWYHQTVSGCLSKAEERGLVCKTGEVRLSPSNQNAYVYFSPAHIPVQDRMPVCRKGVPAFDWTARDEERLDADARLPVAR